MISNFWIEKSLAMVENEALLVKAGPNTRRWFDDMSSVLPAIYPADPTDFGPQIGIAHHLRLTKFGIEGVLKIPKRFFRLSYHVLYEKTKLEEPFWVVFKD